MPTPAAVRYRPTWNRRVPGWALLAFFVSLIVLTYLAVYFYNIEAMDLTGIFTGLASAAPLLVIYLAYVVRPVWAFQATLPEPAVAEAVRAATAGRTVEPVTERKSPFAECSTVLKVADPACTIGWFVTLPPAAATAVPARTTVLFLARTRDRKALGALRDGLSAAFLRALGTAS